MIKNKNNLLNLITILEIILTAAVLTLFSRLLWLILN